MAEAPLRAVPNADESIQQQPVTTKEPYKVSSGILTDAHDLNEKLKEAERLLFYAAEAGIDIETNVRDAVLKAKVTDTGSWSEQTAANLLSALTTLAAKLKPVTADSLKECGDGPTVRTFIRWYKRMTIVLAVCIVPFSLVTFITSAISEAIRKDIETANGLAVKLGDEVRSMRAQNPIGKDALPSHVSVRDLQEFAATIRAIDARAWQLNLFLAYTTSDPFKRHWWSSQNRDAELKEKLELPPGIPDFSKAATRKIEVYQDVRYFAQSIRETVSTIYGAMGTCLLPVFYALLGACAYLLRSLEEQIKLRTFTKSDAHTTRFLIAAIAGGVVGMFNNFNISQNTSVPPLAIAFLVGYAADVFFSFLEGLLQTFTRRADSQTPSAAKS
jgi:hypothetical protein